MGGFGGPERTEVVFCAVYSCWGCLTTESVEGTSLSLQGIYDVHRRHCFPLSVLRISDRVSDDVFQENLQYSTGLLIDEAGDTLDTTSAGKTTDGWLGDTLDVITEYLPVTLSASLSESLSSFTTSRHDCFSECKI